VEAKKYPFAFRPKGETGTMKNITIKGFDLFATSITTDNDYNYYKNDKTKSPTSNGSKALSASENVVIDGLDIQYVYHTDNAYGDWQQQYNGRSGIVLTGSNHEFKNSTIQYSAASALSVSGENNRVYNNILYDINYMVGECGVINFGIKVQKWHSYDHKVRYNTIYNTTHAAISIRNFDNSNGDNKSAARIANNYIYNALSRAWDVGVIEGGGLYANWARIDHNLIVGNDTHNSTANRVQFGIYVDYGKGGDNRASKFIIDHNAVHNFRNPIGLNACSENLVFNNTCFNRDYWADISGVKKYNDYTIVQNNSGKVTLESENGLMTMSNNEDYTFFDKDV
jgi:hypothetical protein